MSDKLVVSCEIIDLSHDGRGVGRIDGKACFIDGALPRETVEFRYTKRKRNYDEGRITKVINASPDRVEPSCKHFSRCGGCSLQHLSHEEQVAFKQQQLFNSLDRGGLKVDRLLPAISASQWGYRRRARLAVQRAKDGKYNIGFRNAGSRRIEPITQCPVLTAPLSEIVALLPVWLQQQCGQYLVHTVELIAADKAVAVAVEARSLPVDDELSSLLESLQDKIKTPVQLWWKADQQAGFTRLDKASDRLSFGVTKDIQLNFAPGQFIQINGQINRDMVSQMLSLLPHRGGTAVDLYCGTGNLSLPLSQYFDRVIGIEGLPDLVKGAEYNAAHNNIDNVEFAVADLSTGIDLNHSGLQQNKNIDVIVLDPPRNGAAGVMPWVEKSTVPKVLYISCHPSTMIRDASVLAEAGYAITAAGVMDMFPHTTHIEAMVLFEKP
ncbi:23S rRNA (uracil(1939)-C(5))-methyltransferase RlmD [Porticoccaceae bacterium]|nr:23S rRNA (uracil(1939)-C(5))-methyltransferase RlmD [Porticoccaceae bacterium]